MLTELGNTRSELASTERSPEGYDAIESYLVKHKPYLVVTHIAWPDGPVGRDYFRQTYSPIAAVHRMWSCLRNDLLARLALSSDSPEAAASFHYRGDEIDEEYIRRSSRVRSPQLHLGHSRDLADDLDDR